MEKGYRRWACGALAVILALLTGCAAVVYAVDPCFYFRAPGEEAVFFNERYQNAGLAKNLPADTVILGTSMVANYRAGRAAELFGGTAVKLTVPDGYLSEFTQVLEAVFRSGTPQRVLFGLDLNILIRDESGKTDAMPEYLYNDSRLDDLQYLLNKDALYYSVYALLARRSGAAQPLDEAFFWSEDTWWNHMTALENYQRPEPADTPKAADAYRENALSNAQTVRAWAEAHPDTEFFVFFSPYSMLYWDKVQRLGETDAVLGAADAAVQCLLGDGAPENLRLFFLPAATEITDDLDYYADYIHHSGETADAALALLREGDFEIFPEQWEKTLSNWRTFVVHYDYEKFWTKSFWWAWNIDHGAPVVWQPAS